MPYIYQVSDKPIGECHTPRNDDFSPRPYESVFEVSEKQRIEQLEYLIEHVLMDVGLTRTGPAAAVLTSNPQVWWGHYSAHLAYNAQGVTAGNAAIHRGPLGELLSSLHDPLGYTCLFDIANPGDECPDLCSPLGFLVWLAKKPQGTMIRFGYVMGYKE